MKPVWGILAMATTSLTLTGCMGPLPDEQRYQFINHVKGAVDPASFGTITSDGYDDGDGVWASSSYAANIEGDSAYETIRDRMIAIPNVKNCDESENRGVTMTSCYLGGISLTVSKETQSKTAALFTVLDTSSGRNPDGVNDIMKY